MDGEDVGIDVEEVEAEGTDPITRLLEYVPLWKGKIKVLKDIDERKVQLQTPLLLDEIVFKQPHLGHVPLLNLKNLDLTNHDKFPHLETE